MSSAAFGPCFLRKHARAGDSSLSLSSSAPSPQALSRDPPAVVVSYPICRQGLGAACIGCDPTGAASPQKWRRRPTARGEEALDRVRTTTDAAPSLKPASCEPLGAWAPKAATTRNPPPQLKEIPTQRTRIPPTKRPPQTPRPHATAERQGRQGMAARGTPAMAE